MIFNRTKKHLLFTTTLLITSLLAACSSSGEDKKTETAKIIFPVHDTIPLKPLVVTDTSIHDTDDPAIWVNPNDPSKSLILGTDKNEDGAVYVYDLNGKIDQKRTVRGLKRPNNIDVEYGLKLGGKKVDIAVVSERLTHNVRVFSLPDMQPIDNGGFPAFEGETGEEFRDLMGISCYKNKKGQIYVIVGRKNGPTTGSYLWQYLLEEKNGKLGFTLVRKFGKYSGKNEIESIAVDDQLGYVYYSDETVGVRKYYADPSKGNKELALFATTGFKEDHEGISIYNLNDKEGYILVSDQQNNTFHIFPREGVSGKPHNHPLLKTVRVSTNESDGSEVCALPFGKQFPKGLFVAMSDNKTFQFYSWEAIAGKELRMIP
ncbi:phytase [Fluviicola sp.]|uniref:phytase n=1 Tax=Fluviicola sp. TaxID=1917219 RepID=UPI003D2766C6